MERQKQLNRFLTGLCVFSIIYAFFYVYLHDLLKVIFNLSIIICVLFCSYHKIKYFMQADKVNFFKELRNMAILYFAVTIGFACLFDLFKSKFSFDEIAELQKAMDKVKIAEERYEKVKKEAEDKEQRINEMIQNYTKNPEELNEMVDFFKDQKIRALTGRTAITLGPDTSRAAMEKDWSREINRLEDIKNGFFGKFEAEIKYSKTISDSSQEWVEAKKRGVESVTLHNFIYFSATTITTLGSGEIRPTSRLTKMFVVIEVFMGLFLIVVYINAAAFRSVRKS